MNNIEAIRVLECIATDITGALMDANMTSSKQTALMQKLDAIDLAQKVLRDVSIQHWISVNDEYPLAYEQVFVYDSHEQRVYTDCVDYNNEFLWFANVTHWMPLPYPQPPKEDNHD